MANAHNLALQLVIQIMIFYSFVHTSFTYYVSE